MTCTFSSLSRVQIVCVAVILCRALCCLAQGLNWLPIQAVIQLVLGLNLDAVIDIFLMSSMEQVGCQLDLAFKLFGQKSSC
jgi:uncharacterized membrane protein